MAAISRLKLPCSTPPFNPNTRPDFVPVCGNFARRHAAFVYGSGPDRNVF
jgi:hypothetical protein